MLYLFKSVISRCMSTNVWLNYKKVLFVSNNTTLFTISEFGGSVTVISSIVSLQFIPKNYKKDIYDDNTWSNDRSDVITNIFKTLAEDFCMITNFTGWLCSGQSCSEETISIIIETVETVGLPLALNLLRFIEPASNQVLLNHISKHSSVKQTKQICVNCWLPSWNLRTKHLPSLPHRNILWE